VDEFDFDKTSVLRKEGFPTRHLGTLQMSTDTAALCTKRIACDLQPFASIPFIDRPEFDIDIDGESGEKVIMNFRYIRGEDGRPEMDPAVLELIKTVDFDLDSME